MSYFKEENFRGDKRLPNNFMTGFLEVSRDGGITATRDRMHTPERGLANGRRGVGLSGLLTHMLIKPRLGSQLRALDGIRARVHKLYNNFNNEKKAISRKTTRKLQLGCLSLSFLYATDDPLTPSLFWHVKKALSGYYERPNSSLARMNSSATVSLRACKSLRPFCRAATAVPSVTRRSACFQEMPRMALEVGFLLTIGLDSDVHLGL